MRFAPNNLVYVFFLQSGASLKMTKAFLRLIEEVRDCKICKANLPLGPRPVLQLSPTAKILIVGQAPGKRAHESGIPFDDASGERLRSWMGIDRSIFYDSTKVAILPMGFCYPGTGKSGDLPPRSECAEAWRTKLLAQVSDLQLTLIIGQYAQDWHLGARQKSNLTETVQAWEEYLPAQLPLPHPSPRNNVWLKKNPWFVRSVIPKLQKRIAEICGSTN